MTKAKKLPDVWVALDEDGVAWCGTERDYGDHAGFTVHAYTPAKPAKVCVWVRDKASIATNGHTACGWWMDRDSQFNFCPRCGGKIKVKR